MSGSRVAAITQEILQVITLETTRVWTAEDGLAVDVPARYLRIMYYTVLNGIQ